MTHHQKKQQVVGFIRKLMLLRRQGETDLVPVIDAKLETFTHDQVMAFACHWACQDQKYMEHLITRAYGLERP